MQFTFTRLVCAAIKHARSPRSLMGGSAQSEGDYVVSRMRQRWTQSVAVRLYVGYNAAALEDGEAVGGRFRTKFRSWPHGRTGGGIGASKSSFVATLRHAVIKSVTSRSSI